MLRPAAESGAACRIMEESPWTCTRTPVYAGSAVFKTAGLLFAQLSIVWSERCESNAQPPRPKRGRLAIDIRPDVAEARFELAHCG